MLLFSSILRANWPFPGQFLSLTLWNDDYWLKPMFLSIHYKMGSDLSKSSLHSPTLRLIHIQISPTKTLSVSLPAHSKATIRWLLSQVRSHCPFPLLGLKSLSQNEALDLWLSQLGRSVEPLRDGEKLEIVTSGNAQYRASEWPCVS